MVSVPENMFIWWMILYVRSLITRHTGPHQVGATVLSNEASSLGQRIIKFVRGVVWRSDLLTCFKGCISLKGSGWSRTLEKAERVVVQGARSRGMCIVDKVGIVFLSNGRQ